MSVNVEYANEDLVYALNRRKELEEKGRVLRKALVDLFDCEYWNQEESELCTWVANTYWEILKKKAELVSKILVAAKKDACNFSEEEEFKNLKETGIDLLNEEPFFSDATWEYSYE